MRRLWTLLLLTGCAQQAQPEIETDNRTARLADVGVIAFYCSDPRNAGYEQYVHNHRPGLGEAHNIRIYPVRFPGSFAVQLSHGSEAERSMILEAGTKPLVEKARHEASRLVITFAYHDACAMYHGQSAQQLADARAAEEVLQKRFDLPVILQHERMTDHLIDVEIINHP